MTLKLFLFLFLYFIYFQLFVIIIIFLYGFCSFMNNHNKPSNLQVVFYQFPLK